MKEDEHEHEHEHEHVHSDDGRQSINGPRGSRRMREGSHVVVGGFNKAMP